MKLLPRLGHPSNPIRIPSSSDRSLLHLIDQCVSPSSLQSLLSLHPRLLSLPHLSSQPSVRIKLIRAFSSCGDLSRARAVFDSSPVKNTVFFNVMIRGYVTNGYHLDAVLLFKSTSRDYSPDCYTYPCVLKSCSESKDLLLGLQIHSAIARTGLDANIFVGNTLIAMYSRCGFLDDAYKVFDEMPNRDVVSWNAIIAGLSNGGLGDHAIKLCKKMLKSGKTKPPDAGTMASILPAMAKAMPEDISFVRKMFDSMMERELISWNAMISIYASNSLAKEAVELFLRMEKESSVEPDAVTLASVLPACGGLSALELGKRIHKLVKKKRMCPNKVLENALLDMYANCGSLKDARAVFDEMLERDVVVWTSIISAYGMHSYGHEAIRLFERMLESGLKPDAITFVSVLAACSHAGLLNKGKYYFNCMTNKYRIDPKLEHYTCMVDLLGRAGCIEEAYDFIIKMPIAPDARVWGALLSACRVHSNLDIGLVAADNLLKLVPEQTGYYVLLSNIYARAGKWEQVGLVRSVLSNRGIKKLPGHSIVELANKVYAFHVGDNTHPQIKLIYQKLDFLFGKMKEMGYNAETAYALHDVEEEDKAGHLSVHSEKLAIAFVLINTGTGTPVRVTMNLRMCGDCHHAVKLISVIENREIIVKDANRFHHIKEGFCSCGDYW